MTAIKGTVRNGRVELATPPDWPEGCEVLVEPLPSHLEKLGIDESEWRDDPASQAEWDEWIKTLQPLEFSGAEETAFARLQEAMQRFNRDAVRRQMEEPSP